METTRQSLIKDKRMLSNAEIYQETLWYTSRDVKAVYKASRLEEKEKGCLKRQKWAALLFKVSYCSYLKRSVRCRWLPSLIV